MKRKTKSRIYQFFFILISVLMVLGYVLKATGIWEGL